MKTKNEKRLVKIGKAAEMLGTTPATLRFWERTGELLPARKTAGGTRYYDIDSLKLPMDTSDPAVCCTVCYAVAYKDREELGKYCEAEGWNCKIVTGYVGSCEVLALVLKNEIKRIVVSHRKDLVKIGSEVIFDLCKKFSIDICAIHK